jgi:von Willebrand factor type A domain
MSRLLIALLAATTLVLSLNGSASGFGTVNRFGQHAEHERITRAALSCAAAGAPGKCFQPTSILNLAGGPGTFGGVGAPDSDEIFTAEAHCDDADFLAGTYPRTRTEATAQLMACRAHVQGRFRQAVRAAADLLDSAGHLKKAEVDLHSTCTFFGGASGRAKCDVLEGLGRTLHGTEDFYSHSNWADQSDPARPVGVNNPPGLASAGVAPVLSLRSAAVSVPPALSTGCFSLNPFGCRKRVTHSVLNKDEGIIDPVTGATSGPTTPRGRIGTNFARAVAGAILEARRQWSDLADEILATYGPTKGNLMICAITHDDPMKDCTGRLLVIVVDSSGSNQDTDPGNLRISAAQAFNDALISEAEAKDDERPDQSASVDFDDSARLISSLGDPPRTSFAGIDSDGGTDIGAGVSVAIQELTKDPNVDPRDRGGIVILTDGQDGGSSLPGALAQAQSLGIRVSFGFLSPPANPVPPPVNPLRSVVARAAQAADQPPLPDYLPAILATGGSYAVIDSAQAQRSFVDLAQKNGITNLDDPSGSSPGGPLVTGLASAGLASATPATWTYRLRPGGTAEITVQAAAGSVLAARVRDVRTLDDLTAAKTNADGTATLRVRSLSGEVQIDVLTAAGQIPYTVRADERDVLVSGTPGADELTCSGTEPAYVQAGDGNDGAVCASAADTLVGGPGTDRLAGREGDDLFILAKPDLKSGTEQLDGGAGNDTALFLFERPKGVKCKQNTTATVPLGRGTVRLAGIERVLFAYRACNAPRLPSVSLGRLRATGAKPPSLVPPRPAVRASATRRAVNATVRVGAATAVLVSTTVRSGHKRATLPSALRNVPHGGRYRFTLHLTKQARRLARRGGRATVSVTTAGTLDGPQRHKTVHVRLKR